VSQMIGNWLGTRYKIIQYLLFIQQFVARRPILVLMIRTMTGGVLRIAYERPPATNYLWKEAHLTREKKRLLCRINHCWSLLK
jgi:hypothetical protein